MSTEEEVVAAAVDVPKKTKKKRKKKKAGRVIHAEWRVRVKEREGSGRYAYATAALPTGTVLMAEEAYAWIPHYALAGRVCGFCTGDMAVAKPNELVRCVACRSIFCNAECAARGNHDATCAAVAVLMSSPAAPFEKQMGALIIRCIMQADDPGVSPVDGAKAGSIPVVRATRADVDGLCDHVEHLTPAQVAQAEGQFSQLFASPDFAAAVEPYGSADELTAAGVRLMGVINTNACALFSKAGALRTIGTGVFPHLAMLNHSCTPNCTLVPGPGGSLELRNIAPVHSGDELFISYTDVLAPYASRKAKLQTERHFVCTCARCAQAEAGDGVRAGVLCPHCPPPPDGTDPADVAVLTPVGGGTGGGDPDTPLAFACSTCEAVLDDPAVAALLTPVTDLRNSAYALARASRYHDATEVLDEALALAASVVHPHHYLCESLLAAAGNAARYCGNIRAVATFAGRLADLQLATHLPYDIETLDKLVTAAEAHGTYLQHKRLPPKFRRTILAAFKRFQAAALDYATVLHGEDAFVTARIAEMAEKTWRAPLPPAEQKRITAADVAAASHGHSHNGVPCHGHGAPAASSGDHGHSHGGASSASGHGHSHGGASSASGHGHSHGGAPCDGTH